MGSFIAQELTLSNPEKVDKLILYASLCGGNESKLASPKVDQAFSNPLVSPQEQMERIIPYYFQLIGSKQIQIQSLKNWCLWMSLENKQMHR
jgi:hypothetical protein